jgi:hypothetical protein
MGTGHSPPPSGLTTAAISAMATRLEVGGYAHRDMDPTDRHRVLISAIGSDAASADLARRRHGIALRGTSFSRLVLRA